MVAESVDAEVEADERVDAELVVEFGVLVSSRNAVAELEEAWVATVLSIDNRGFTGLPKAGAAEIGASYAFEKVFRTVGDIAERVSSRRLEPLPKVRIWVV